MSGISAVPRRLQPVTYDPEAAKKLLAEAGYPNGFELSIATWGPSRRIAEAVAGQFRKIGVNAKVDSSTIGVFVQKRADGKIQTQVSLWDNGVAQPDIESTMSFFFAPSSRDAIGDPMLAKAVDDGRAELDPKKREAIYRAAFDRVTAERYMMPLVPTPAVVAHDKSVQAASRTQEPRGNRAQLHLPGNNMTGVVQPIKVALDHCAVVEELQLARLRAHTAHAPFRSADGNGNRSADWSGQASARPMAGLGISSVGIGRQHRFEQGAAYRDDAAPQTAFLPAPARRCARDTSPRRGRPCIRRRKDRG